ncbi:Uncharacterized protein TCM_030497 [Theobroma cacao]|uniref:Uncharacterized protein n=1 Tax=Theobroma cacao TaxID=3641 RepID=A0A061FBF2_THECC|nr:Uncharacterized protein TCM_030497 [Theobroma cacao]
MLMMQSSYDTTLSANNREELILVVVTNSNSSGVPPSSPLPTCQAIAFVFIVIFVTLIYAPNSKQPHLCGRKQLGHGLMVSWGLLLAIHRRSRQDGWTDESSNDLLTTLSGLWNNGSATAASVLSLTQDVYDCSATAIVAATHGPDKANATGWVDTDTAAAAPTFLKTCIALAPFIQHRTPILFYIKSGLYEEVNGHCFSRMNLCSVEEIKMKFNEVKVLFVTCLGITCPFFSEKKFVACIVDEAG